MKNHSIEYLYVVYPTSCTFDLSSSLTKLFINSRLAEYVKSAAMRNYNYSQSMLSVFLYFEKRTVTETQMLLYDLHTKT
jgi:hypothetical protein